MYAKLHSDSHKAVNIFNYTNCYSCGNFAIAIHLKCFAECLLLLRGDLVKCCKDLRSISTLESSSSCSASSKRSDKLKEK
mmetsp:Transcript_29147/g.49426  ORF Transcript_29147/g.49426 Transcript_29147/m.49426 type:complete len:80 (-) Transcript_29147:633-872(-)